MESHSFVERAVYWLGQQMQKRVPYSSSNPYLQGPFKPVDCETTETALRITGSIPNELNGMLARIGPNPAAVANPAAYHWFLGDGMVHGLRLQEGRALWYRSRWVGSDSIRRRQGAATAPGRRRGVADTVNTNIVGHAGRCWAITEAGVLPVEMDGELNTLRHGYYNSDLMRAHTAHPHLDPKTGELHAICYEALNPFRVHYVVIDTGGHVRRVVDIPVKHGPMIHDCALTQRYVLVFDLPVTFSFAEVLRGNSLPYRWNDRHPARVGLLPREGSAKDIRWCEVDPCYVFHMGNAYDLDDGGVVVDVVAYASMFGSKERSMGPDSQELRFERWRIDTTQSHASRTVIHDVKQEFPRLDERRYAQPYRYAYTVGVNGGVPGPQPLFKHDLQKGSVTTQDFGGRSFSNEAVFVPRSRDAAEDDGWLLSYVCRLDEDRSDVVILNAQDVDGPPQAVIHLPVRVPIGFHGNWIADS